MVKVRKAIGSLLNLFKPEPLKPTLLNTAHMMVPTNNEAETLAAVHSQSVNQDATVMENHTQDAMEAFAMMDALKGAESASIARTKAAEEEIEAQKIEEEKVVPLFPAFAPGTDAAFAQNVSAQLAAAEATQAALQQLEKLAQMAGHPLENTTAQPQEDATELMQDGIEDAVIVEDSSTQEVVQLGPVDPLDMPALVREKYISHQLWLETEGREGKRFRYIAEDMQGQRFSGLNLAQAQFRGEDLYGMQFDGANLREADFSDCNLQRTNFGHAKMDGANVSRANLAFANMNYVSAAASNFSGANLEGTMLRDCNFADSNMRDANFQGTIAMHSIFVRAQLRNASFLEAILENADFTDADMRASHMVRGLLTETKFDGATFKGAVLEEIDFSAADFTLANDVAEEYQRTALSVARGKLQTTREKLDNIQETLKRREYRIHETARELSNRLQQLRQMEGQENKLLDIIRAQGRWMRNSGFWWAGVVAIVTTFSWFALSDMVERNTNIGAVAFLATFNVVVIGLSVMSFYRSIVVCRSVQTMFEARQQYANQLTGLEQEFEAAPEMKEMNGLKSGETQALPASEQAEETDSAAPQEQAVLDYSAVMPLERSDATAPQTHVA